MRGIVRTLTLESHGVSYRQRLIDLLRERSLFRGDFTLASGKKSTYYLDCKLTTLSPEGAVLTGNAILELLEDRGIQAAAIGGQPIGADPIVAATVAVSYLEYGDREDKQLQGILIREEPKKHGMQKRIEGVKNLKGTRVVIVDEVCTTGKSTLKAIETAESEGMIVVAVISLVDREEGGSEILKKRYNYYAVCTAQELLSESARSAGTSRRTPSTAGSETPFHR